MSDILFILKRKHDYNLHKDNHIGLTTGLFNSASFMDIMLNESGITSEMSVVHDNNDIDREVSRVKPKYVIIEALWVVPEKFEILQKLHPNVKWIIRIHSEMPFMAGEGIAMRWIGSYLTYKNVILAINAPRMFDEIKFYAKMIKPEYEERVIYLPNSYPVSSDMKESYAHESDIIKIGCFGAVRPMKNHLLQAYGALMFAESIGKRLEFHINSGRTEMKGEPCLHNLQGLFENVFDNGHRLIAHEWADHDSFLKICSEMDIGMQVSFSETFNIVGADFVNQGIPFVGSAEIPWCLCDADPNSSTDIAHKLLRAYSSSVSNVKHHQKSIRNYSEKTRKIWIKYFGETE